LGKDFKEAEADARTATTKTGFDNFDKALGRGLRKDRLCG